MDDLPLGWRTDLDVLRRSGSRVTAADGHLVVETPDNPGYYWGNFLYIIDRDLAGRPADCLMLMKQELPHASHVAVGLPDAPVAAAWQEFGVEVEMDEVLAADVAPTGRDLPAGYHARPLAGDDWERSLRNEVAGSGASDMRAHSDFARRRIESRRRMVENGDACFFGVFCDEELVADLGIVLCDGAARYQSVGTVVAHRRRGLASHLLWLAGDWAGQRGATQWVIVAEPGSDAARLYRACGMRPVGRSWQAFRRPR